jgi:amino acid adenylation domain-containing protein
VARALVLEGRPPIPALEAAFAALPARHPALGLSFSQAPEGPRQRAGAARPCALAVGPLPSADLAPEARRQAAITRALEAPWELEQGPLLRASLFEEAPERWLLIVTAHPLGVDRWSLQLLFDDLERLCAPDAPPPAPPSFLAPLQWAQAHPEAADRDAAFWRERLAGFPGVVELTTELWRASNASFRREAVPLSLPAVEGGAEAITAALAAVASRSCGEERLLLATRTAGRQALGTHGTVGAFERPALLCLQARADQTFAALREEVRRARRDAWTHPRIRPASLADALATTQSPPDFRPPQLGLTVERPFAPWTLAGVSVTDLDLPWRAEPQPLSLQLTLGADGARGHLVFDPGLFRPDAAVRLGSHLAALLADAQAHPDRPLARLALLGDAERERLTRTLNPPSGGAPEGLVHTLFEAQAARTPTAQAVSHGQDALSYGELNARANRMARALAKAGVGPEAKVVLALQPGVDTIAALYAVLKAGGAYVPVDPDGPPERLRFIVQDAGAALVVCEAALLPVFEGLEAKALPLGALSAGQDGDAASENPGVRLSPDHLAYVIYTSGSTGEPKGVQVAHRSVVNHNLAVARRFGLNAQDRVLQFTPITFDAAGEEIYPPLLAGSAIVVRGELAPIHGFRELIEQERLTVLSLPPAFLHEWVLELERRGERVPGCLRLVLLGGEKLLPESLACWQRVGGEKIPWVNVYGPTEATVTSALCELGAGALGLTGPTLPIGGPLDNAQLYLLDPRMELVPFGHTGELYIGGAGLARGYLGKPALTAERFLPDPFSARPGARLYRTGDLARHLPDGRLEFVGRADHQVKIRGFRVELGEVEAALRRQEGVEECVVLAREEAPRGTHLVAYVIPARGVTLDAKGLKAALRAGLPDYMIPSALGFLEAFPLTPNGKVDRKALPPLELEAAGPGAGRPLTEQEQALAEIWQEVLGAPQVGPEDDFFELGGQSLSAMQVLSRISEIFGVELLVQDVFEAPLLSALAERVQAAMGPDTDAMSDDQVDAMLAELLAKQRAMGG